MTNKILWGLLFIAVGAWLLMSNYGLVEHSFRFSRDWPILLIAVGLLKLFDVVFGRTGCKKWEKLAKLSGCCHPHKTRREILDELEKGGIKVDEAITKLKE